MRACNNLPQPNPYILVFGGCGRLLHALTPSCSAFIPTSYFIFILVADAWAHCGCGRSDISLSLSLGLAQLFCLQSISLETASFLLCHNCHHPTANSWKIIIMHMHTMVMTDIYTVIITCLNKCNTISRYGIACTYWKN